MFVAFYSPMHLFSVSTAIPVFALAMVLINSNLNLALSDFSVRIVAFAYTGWGHFDFRHCCLLVVLLDYPLLLSRDLVRILNLFGFSMILTLSSRSNCLLSFAVWALLLAGIGFPLLLT